MSVFQPYSIVKIQRIDNDTQTALTYHAKKFDSYIGNRASLFASSFYFAVADDAHGFCEAIKEAASSAVNREIMI